MHQIIANRTENLQVIINSYCSLCLTFSIQVEVFIKIAIDICNLKESVHQCLSDIVWKSITDLMENVCNYSVGLQISIIK